MLVAPLVAFGVPAGVGQFFPELFGNERHRARRLPRLTALVLVPELTHTGFAFVVPLAVTTALATAVARRVDEYSIYSGRLAARPPV